MTNAASGAGSWQRQWRVGRVPSPEALLPELLPFLNLEGGNSMNSPWGKETSGCVYMCVCMRVCMRVCDAHQHMHASARASVHLCHTPKNVAHNQAPPLKFTCLYHAPLEDDRLLKVAPLHHSPIPRGTGSRRRACRSCSAEHRRRAQTRTCTPSARHTRAVISRASKRV